VLDVPRLFDTLFSSYGPQRWWPAEHRFEVMVGALLVQRTSWTNAARAIERLRAAGLLDHGALAKIDEESLQRSIRSAGFHRAKAPRLRRLAKFVASAGGMKGLSERSTEELRHALLAIDGIGEETADAILLYAFDRPVAVVDEYTRRVFDRVSGTAKHYTDVQIRAAITGAVKETEQLNELHALIAEHGKRSCRKTPVCSTCCLTSWCAFSRG
jgi:endonuclease III related protein